MKKLISLLAVTATISFNAVAELKTIDNAQDNKLVADTFACAILEDLLLDGEKEGGVILSDKIANQMGYEYNNRFERALQRGIDRVNSRNHLTIEEKFSWDCADISTGANVYQSLDLEAATEK